MPRRPTRPSVEAGLDVAAPAPRVDGDGSAARVMDALRRLVRELSASARGGTRGRGGSAGAMSGARLYVMRQIAAAPGLSVGELAARTHARQSAVSEVVARLVDAGLVARRAHATDGRQVSLSLTPRGRRAIAGAARTTPERLADALAVLAPAEREALASAMEGWLAAAGMADTPPTMFFEQDAEG